jgi:hypothetical protein
MRIIYNCGLIDGMVSDYELEGMWEGVVTTSFIAPKE